MSTCNCRGNTIFKSSRREFLTVGALGALGFTLGDLLKLAVAAGLLPIGWWLVKQRSSDL